MRGGWLSYANICVSTLVSLVTDWLTAWCQLSASPIQLGRVRLPWAPTGLYEDVFGVRKKSQHPLMSKLTHNSTCGGELITPLPAAACCWSHNNQPRHHHRHPHLLHVADGVCFCLVTVTNAPQQCSCHCSLWLLRADVTSHLASPQKW